MDTRKKKHEASLDERAEILITQLIVAPKSMPGFSGWSDMDPATASRVIQNIGINLTQQTVELLNEDARVMLQIMRSIEKQDRVTNDSNQLQIFEEIFNWAIPSYAKTAHDSYQALMQARDNAKSDEWKKIAEGIGENKHFAMNKDDDAQKVYEKFTIALCGSYIVGLSQRYNTLLTVDRLQALQKQNKFKKMTQYSQMLSYIGSTPSAMALLLEYANTNTIKDENATKNLMNNILRELIFHDKINDGVMIKLFQLSEPAIFESMQKDVVLRLKSEENKLNDPAVSKKLNDLKEEKKDLKSQRKELDNEISKLNKEEKETNEQSGSIENSESEKKLAELEEKRDEISKKIGKITGKINEIELEFNEAKKVFDNIDKALSNNSELTLPEKGNRLQKRNSKIFTRSISKREMGKIPNVSENKPTEQKPKKSLSRTTSSVNVIKNRLNISAPHEPKSNIANNQNSSSLHEPKSNTENEKNVSFNITNSNNEKSANLIQDANEGGEKKQKKTFIEKMFGREEKETKQTSRNKDENEANQQVHSNKERTVIIKKPGDDYSKIQAKTDNKKIVTNSVEENKQTDTVSKKSHI